jgi:hypothetical protein
MNNLRALFVVVAGARANGVPPHMTKTIASDNLFTKDKYSRWEMVKI